MRSVIRPLTAVLAATALASCMDLSAPSAGSRLSLAIVPRFSESAPTASATAKPIEVVVSYTGPGSTAASIQVTPGAGLYSASSATQFSAKAFDSNNIELTSAPIFWSVSDKSKATISSSGLLTPTGNRGTINVIATTANGVSKSISVDLAPGAAGLRVIQGAGQSGPGGSVLPLDAVVELY